MSEMSDYRHRFVIRSTDQAMHWIQLTFASVEDDKLPRINDIHFETFQNKSHKLQSTSEGSQCDDFSNI